MSTGQFPQTRKTAKQVFEDLVEQGRRATDHFAQFRPSKSRKRDKATA